MDCQEIQPVHPKGDQSWVFIGRTDVEAETPILWPPDAKSQLTEKTLMLGKTEGRRRRGRQRMRWVDGITDSMDALGDSEGQGGRACCSPWGRRESDMTQQMSNTSWATVRRCRRGFECTVSFHPHTQKILLL